MDIRKGNFILGKTRFSFLKWLYINYHKEVFRFSLLASSRVSQVSKTVLIATSQIFKESQVNQV